jgi:hypothetical protein
LDNNERLQLGALLEKIAAEQGLTQGVHPGFNDIHTRGDATACTDSQPPE